MSKVIINTLLSTLAICCFSGNASASDTTSSPISFILAEAGISVAPNMKQGRRNYTPHLGYESITLPTNHGSKMKLHGKNIKENRSIDNIHLNLGQNKARCEQLEKKLTAKYGVPKSRRNNIRVWELANVTAETSQSKTVTIMAGEEKGEYFLTVDRRGPRTGNNPRTNSSLRKAKQPSLRRKNIRRAATKIDRSITD